MCVSHCIKFLFIFLVKMYVCSLEKLLNGQSYKFRLS